MAPVPPRLEVTARDQEGTVLGYLGPDLLGADWDADEALRRLLAAPNRPVFLALLDQRNLAGLGNEYVNELCFLRGVLPTCVYGRAGKPCLRCGTLIQHATLGGPGEHARESYWCPRCQA